VRKAAAHANFNATIMLISEGIPYSLPLLDFALLSLFSPPVIGIGFRKAIRCANIYFVTVPSRPIISEYTGPITTKYF